LRARRARQTARRGRRQAGPCALRAAARARFAKHLFQSTHAPLQYKPFRQQHSTYYKDIARQRVFFIS
jgi:hypothetical protein